MVATKKSVKPKKVTKVNKTTKKQTLKSTKSKMRFVPFVLIFALIGGYFVFQAFAAKGAVAILGSPDSKDCTAAAGTQIRETGNNSKSDKSVCGLTAGKTLKPIYFQSGQVKSNSQLSYLSLASDVAGGSSKYLKVCYFINTLTGSASFSLGSYTAGSTPGAGTTLNQDTGGQYSKVCDPVKIVAGTNLPFLKTNTGTIRVGSVILEPTTAPVVTPSVGTGVWISPQEIAALPTSGKGWENVQSTALGSLGTVNLADNNNVHDTNVLALAYYSARTGDATKKQQVVREIDTVKSSGRARALEFCRNITSYIISADVVNLKTLNPTVDTNFRAYVKQWVMTDTSLQGHSGGAGIKGTAEKSASNWGGMCRAAYSSAAVYLGDSVALDNVTKWQKGFLGDRSVYSGFNYTSTNWHADPNAKRGINAKGATIQGQNVDGVIPEDQRRTGEFTWPAPKGGYPWEVLQGAVVTDVVLQRAGKLTNNYQDSAMVRAYDWLMNVNNNPPTAANDELDDAWQLWLVNKKYGTTYPKTTNTPAGKNMAWTEWTHQ